ncbi:MAG: T9SS type A sorting domain-containing protein [Melioribacteraceae bacterium]|nr:T9SS type A sorting domain-containing protein [Melioribacteraceae bacterium]
MSIQISAQIISGRIIDQNEKTISDLLVQIYMGEYKFTATTSPDGNFQFDVLVSVEDEELPSGYSISNNFPNPFNPTTRININVPDVSTAKVDVYNILGQRVFDLPLEKLTSGINSIDIVLDGLSNGIYLAVIRLNEKFTVTKKMMLLYGTEHLDTHSINLKTMFKSAASDIIPIDSIVVTGDIIEKASFFELPVYTGIEMDLGDFVVTYKNGSPCTEVTIVDYAGKTYHTVQIGEQCWLKENLDVGSVINGNQDMTNNGEIEKYYYDNDTLLGNKYGGLYEWNEAMQYNTQEGAQGICPEGWHIPTIEELRELKITLNHDGNALKSIDEGSGNGFGTNISGFSALLAGAYYNNESIFSHEGYYGLFWSSSETSTTFTFYMGLTVNNNNIYLNDIVKSNAFCVRCIKNK